MKYFLFIFFFSTISMSSHADLKSDLTSFIDSVGGGSNVTNASVFKGQGYYYVNGARAFVRTPTRNVSLGSIRLPSYKAGCGGIDIHSGGFSFINEANLVNSLKQIGANAASYFFMLGLRTISSQIASTMEGVQTMAQKFNNLSIDTCKEGQNIVDTVGDNICAQRRMEANNEDYDTAIKNCTVSGSKKEATIANDTVKSRAFISGNLAWIVATESNMFNNDEEMKELLISITGTLIRKKVANSGAVVEGDENAKPDEKYWEPLVLSDGSLFEAIFTGGTADIYDCPTGSTKFNCKTMGVKSINITYEQSIKGRYDTAFSNIYSAINDTSTDPAISDVNYVANAAFSAHANIAMAASIGGESGESLLQATIERAAVDTLYSYIYKIIRLMRGVVNDPKYIDQSNRDLFLNNLTAVNNLLKYEKEKIDKRLSSSRQLVENMSFYKQILVSRMPKNLSENLLFDKR